MLYQTFVTDYPPLALAGESHNNARHTSIYQTCLNGNNEVFPGTAQVAVGQFDHTRFLTEDPTAANLILPNAQLIVVHRDRNAANSFVTNRIGATASTTAVAYPADCLYLGVRRGTEYVVVEKAIDPSLPVYIRVANPDASGLQGIGFFTDTPDGANTVEVTAAIAPNVMWCGVDGATYINQKDVNVTDALERERIGLSAGFSVAPLTLQYV